MLRQIAAMSALVLSAAPMVALNSQSVLAAEAGSITFFNQGGYVAEYEVSYTLNGKSHTHKTPRLAVGSKKTYTIPAGSTNIRARGQVITGLFWEPTRLQFDKRYGQLSNDICFKSFGTIFNSPYSNTGCAASF